MHTDGSLHVVYGSEYYSNLLLQFSAESEQLLIDSIISTFSGLYSTEKFGTFASTMYSLLYEISSGSANVSVDHPGISASLKVRKL